MIKVTRIITDDGQMFDDFAKAKKHLEVEYGNRLTKLASKLLTITKYTPMCEYLDKNLTEFEELRLLKKESSQSVEDIYEDE